MIEIISTRESLDAIKRDWEQLFEADSTATPFQRFEYIVASLNFNENWDNLHILIYRLHSKEVVAIFPFVLQKGRLEFINASHTDFCNALIDPAHNNYALYRSVAEYIKENKNIKAVRLENLLRDSSLIASFKADFPYCIIRDCNFYSTVEIIKNSEQEHFVDGITSLNSKKRINLKKKYKQFSADCEFRIVSITKKNSFPKEILSDLVNTMISQGSRSGSYFDRKMFKFWEEMFNGGLVEIGILFEKDVPKVCQFIFPDNKRMELIQWMLVFEKPIWNGRANIMECENAYNSGYSINFARGIYPYKMTNFHPSVYPLFRVDIAKTKWGHFKNLLSAAIYYAKPVVKQIIGRQ